MKQKLLISLFLLVTSAKSEALALVDCIQIALSNKETLKVSAFDLQNAQQTLKGSYSNILPSLIFSGSSSESSFPDQEGGYNPATGEITLGNISNLTSTSTGIDAIPSPFKSFPNAPKALLGILPAISSNALNSALPHLPISTIFNPEFCLFIMVRIVLLSLF
jgi:hypothetical protein